MVENKQILTKYYQSMDEVCFLIIIFAYKQRALRYLETFIVTNGTLHFVTNGTIFKEVWTELNGGQWWQT